MMLKQYAATAVSRLSRIVERFSRDRGCPSRRRLAVRGCRWLVVCVILLSVAVGVGAANGPTAIDTGDLNGSGTTDDPYEISNASELQALEDDLDADYTLVSDINAIETDSWNGGKGFDPIGTCEYDTVQERCTADAFDGSFDGAGYTISNLSVDRTAKEIGLFGGINGATVQDVRLTNVSITGNITSTTDEMLYAGGLVGSNNGTVDSVFVSGQVDGVAINSTASGVFGGGVVGDNNGKLTQSTTTANVTVTAAFGAHAGGVAGRNDGRIEASVATGIVTAESGVNYNGEWTYAGGLVGKNNNRVTDAYAIGDVDGDADVDVHVGGLVGRNDQGQITATYAIGTLTATAGNVNEGGLVGSNFSGTIDDSYFDNTPANGIGNQLSTADMQGSSPPTTTMTGLGDSTVWETVEADDSDATADGYPVLSAVERQRQLELQGINALISVRNWDDLDAVRTDLDEGYLLADDLDDGVLGYDDVAATGANGGNGFDPIGSFSGTFDGRNRTIGNLTVDRTTDKVGLFGSTQSSATLEYVHLESASVAGDDDTGGLVGNSSGSIRYATVDGTVNGSDNVGGIVGYSEGILNASNATATINGSTDVGGVVGYLYQGSITTSTASGDINGTSVTGFSNTNAGGLVGRSNEGTITGSNASGNVRGINTTGGLVGYLYTSDLGTSNASGNVNGTGNNVGGLAGQSFNSTITGTNGSGDVNGTDNTGGLVGYAYYGGKLIKNSSATGAVNGSEDVGGLVGVVGNTDINRSSATGSVDGAINVGGLVGATYGSNTLSELYATGSVDGTNRVGGLVGWNDDGDSRVEQSYAAGTVTATSGIAGGLVGTNRGPVANTSATGTVTGDTAGGLVGINRDTVSTSFATGTVDDTGTNVGGLVGYNDSATTVDAYWDLNTTNQSTSQGGTGLTTPNMTGQNATDTMDGFGFTDTWHATEEYPVLAWRDTEPFYGVSIVGTNGPVTEGDTLDVTANVTNWGADGEQTVTLSDFDDTQQDTTSVSLASGASDDSVDLAWATTTGDAGTHTVTVASENETAVETVTVDSAPDPDPDPDPPTDSPADDIDATVTTDGAVANGSDEVTFTVDVEDDSNDPVSGTTITIDAARDVDALGGLDSGDTAETNTSGAATFTATATDAGEFTVQFSEPDAGSASATATFEAGRPDDLTVDRVDDTAVANGTDTLRFAVTLEDAYDNRVSNATVRTTDTGIDILYGGDDSQETNGNGELTVTAASTTTQANVTFTVEEQAQGITETVTGTFEAGAPDSISADSTVDNATANGSDEVEFTVGVEDENNNPVEGATIEVDDAEDIDALDGIDGNRTETTDATGEAVFTATATDIGEFTVRFSETTAGNDSATVTFEAGEPESIDAEVTQNRATADGNDEVEFTVGIKDENNNPVEGATIEVDDAEDVEELIGIASGETETTTAAGEARFTASATDGGKYAVRFNETDAGTDTATATFESSVDESTSTSESTSSCTVSESDSIVAARSRTDRLRATVDPTISDGVAESRLRICDSGTAEFNFPETESAYANLSTATIERIEFEFTEPVDTTLTVRTGGEPPTDTARRLDISSVKSAGYLGIDSDLEHDRVDEAALEFRLPVEAMETVEDDPEAVSLYRSTPETDDWERHETTVIDETDDTVRFGTTVENVSRFAIGLDRPETAAEPVDETDDEGVGETDDTPTGLLLLGLLLIAGLTVSLWSRADSEESDEETSDGDVDGEERAETGAGGQ
ncbi:hypothetical protein HKK80_02720 [Halonotius sp. F2-221B]|uniref:beta strand repeat-containing protein n=1 Tax=Halonotius sp. F2-221B TaxID=2731620 RepID=UPI00398B9324